jgi:hypothetical protein
MECTPKAPPFLSQTGVPGDFSREKSKKTRANRESGPFYALFHNLRRGNRAAPYSLWSPPHFWRRISMISTKPRASNPIASQPTLPSIASTNQPALPASSRTELQDKQNKHLISQCRTLMKRIGMDSMQLIMHVAELKKINSTDDFNWIITHELKLSTSTVNRWLTIADTAEKYFLNDGAFSSQELTNVTRNAFMLISAESVNETVIADVRDLLKTKGKVSEDDIEKLLESKEATRNRIAVTEAEAELERTKKAAAQLEAQLLKAQANEAAVARRLENAEKDAKALEAELKDVSARYKELVASPSDVGMVEKEVVPKGYKTIREAMEAANKQMMDVQEQLSKTRDEVKAAKEEAAQAKSEAARAKAAAKDVNDVIAEIEVLIAKLPDVLVQRMVANTPEAKAVFNRLAQHLMSFAKVLSFSELPMVGK